MCMCSIASALPSTLPRSIRWSAALLLLLLTLLCLLLLLLLCAVHNPQARSLKTTL
jgi:hypothetical protein